MSTLEPQYHWVASDPGTRCGEPVGFAIHQRIRPCIEAGSPATSPLTRLHSARLVYSTASSVGYCRSRAVTHAAAVAGEAQPGSMSSTSAAGSVPRTSIQSTWSWPWTAVAWTAYGPVAYTAATWRAGNAPGSTES